VTDEDIGDVPLNEMIPLDHQGISGFVVTDSSSAPLTLAAGQYVLDEKAGSLMVTDKTTGGPYVAPFVASYVYEARIAVPFNTVASGGRHFLRFHGLNTQEAGVDDTHLPVLVELYSVEIIPGQDMPLINEEIAQFTLQAQARLDTDRAVDAVLGRFGRVVVTVPPEE